MPEVLQAIFFVIVYVLECKFMMEWGGKATEGLVQSSKQGDFRPLLLTEPYVNLSIHTALQDDVGN